MPNRIIPSIAAICVGFGLTAAFAAEGDKPAAPSADTSAATAPQGLIPVPDYSGDLWTRSHLTGDWGGTRTDLANKGIQIDIGVAQTYQAVTQGGRDTDTAYGGSADVTLTFDLMRMGVLPGALIKVRTESRWGESVNAASGILLPVSTDGLFPLSDPLDDDIPIAVTNLTYYQFLSEHFGVLVGKIDTLDADLGEFAAGRGDSQFMNANFLIPVGAALIVPYSTLAAGVIWMPTHDIMVSSVVMNTVDSSTTSGFDDFGDGTTWSTEARFQYRVFGLPGGTNVGFVYGFDNDFAEIGSGRLVFERGEGLDLTVDTDDDTWVAYWSAWQYLWTEDEATGPVNLEDGRPDHQGVGLFARVGFADEDVNPAQWWASGGIGGRGVIPGRDDDVFGVGYFYIDLATSRFIDRTGIDDHTDGFEAFYNIAITPAAHFTFDVQVVNSPYPDIDNAVIIGGRLHLSF